MRFLATIILVAALFTTNNLSAQNSNITATVVNVTSDLGKVGYALYDKANFMKIPIQASESKIKDGISTVVFKDVPAGEYAVICYHDKNNNDKMDFDENRMPLEDYGMSNNVMAMGPPQFEDAKFVVADKDVSLKIKF